MKKIIMVLATFVVLGMVSGSFGETKGDSVEKAKKVTLTGILVDIKCYLGTGATGNDHMGMKGCGTKCLKDGSPAGLLVDGKLYALIFPSDVLADYVGQKLEITGDLYITNALIPTEAFVVEQGKKKAIKIKGKVMM